MPAPRYRSTAEFLADVQRTYQSRRTTADKILTPAEIEQQLTALAAALESGGGAGGGDLPGREEIDEQIATRAAARDALQPTLDDDLAFSVVDEDGRRTWLEVAPDGGPSEHAVQHISGAISGPIEESVAAGVGIEELDTAVTGLAFVVVDEDDRRTDLEVGPDGHFTQRVVNLLAARIGSGGGTTPVTPTAPTPTVIAPSSIPVVVGQPYSYYYDSGITGYNPALVALTSSSGNGANLGTRWVYTPDAAKSFTLTVKVADRYGTQLTSKAIPVQSYTAPAVTGKRHLAIGDSITRAGNYVGDAVKPFAGYATAGTRTYNGGVLNTEGRGGWSLAGYFTNIGHESWGDSPFLFPTNVAGAKFWGNTQFWKRVCYEDPAGYDYAGFQMMARGWKSDQAQPFLYGTDGYPLAPAEGDVVVDPTFDEADEFRQYTAGSWVAMTRPTIEFSFAKYMARYAAAYPNGGPTSISIMLETNDFFSALDNTNYGVWKTRMDEVIASVRAWSATVPFIILLAPTGGPWEKWTGQTVNKFEFDQRMRGAAERILADYDTAAARTNRVYVASSLAAVAPENLTDWVHPSTPAGHEQLGIPLAGMLARLLTEGTA